MKIETFNFFEQKDGMCVASYDSIIENKEDIGLYLQNPDYIDVCNEIYPDQIYVINDHEYGKFIKYIEGVNRWSADNFITVGAWHIKYKNKC